MTGFHFQDISIGIKLHFVDANLSEFAAGAVRIVVTVIYHVKFITFL